MIIRDEHVDTDQTAKPKPVATGQTPFYKKWWFWVIIVVVVVGVVETHDSTDNTSGSATPAQSTAPAKSATPAQSAAPAKSESTAQSTAPAQSAAPTQVSFEQMVNDYKSNGSMADGKYKGKELEFSGTVKKITDGVLGGYDVDIDAGNFTDNKLEDTTATVNFKDADKDLVNSLVSGQSYTFVATGSGAFIMTDWVSTLSFKNGSVK